MVSVCVVEPAWNDMARETPKALYRNFEAARGLSEVRQTLIAKDGRLRHCVPAMVLPLKSRLLPMEVVMLVLGVLSWGGLTVLWFRLLPGLLEAKGIDPDSLEAMHRIVLSSVFEVTVLAAIMLTLAAGASLRVSVASKWASKVIACGCGLAFGSLLMTVNLFYGPLTRPADDFAREEPEAHRKDGTGGTGPVNWGR